MELLTVCAILATLIALLLPALSTAIEAAHQVVCASNLRQLGVAFRSYAMDNEDMLPRSAAGEGVPPENDDWVHYRPGFAPETSAIAPYLGKFTPALLICPSDDTSVRPRAVALGRVLYPYSYSMNGWVSNCELYNPPGKPMRITAIVNPADKILLVDESEDTIDDGNFDPYSDPWVNLLAKRHDHKRFEFDPQTADPFNPPFPEARGNLLFVDGHVGFEPRSYLTSISHVLPLD